MTEAIERNMAVSLRPRRFSEVVGYTRTVAQIKAQFESGRVPNAMMFVGISRGGKTTLAKIVAAAVNCKHGDFGEPCDDCLAKVEDRIFDIQEINAANLNKVEDARNLVKELCVIPAGWFRVIILDECQQMTEAAQNVLLKPLEEVDGYNLFIFCTTDPGKMNIPLQKRCGSNRFQLDGLNPQEIKQLVWNTSKQVPVTGGWDNNVLAELSSLLWDRHILAPGDVVSAVEAVSNGASADEAAVSAEFSGKINTYLLSQVVLGGNWAKAQIMLRTAEPRDGDPIRLMLAQALRKELLASGGNHTEWCVEALEELAKYETPIAGMQLNTVVASIYKICGLFNQKAQSGLQRVA